MIICIYSKHFMEYYYHYIIHPVPYIMWLNIGQHPQLVPSGVICHQMTAPALGHGVTSHMYTWGWGSPGCWEATTNLIL